jgi:subtilisin family serine protease
LTPTDPLFANQWHLAMLGDIQAIWDEYTGSGVNVGVYDDGVEYTHEDLAANYDASLHVVDDLGNPVDPSPVTSADGHGTACAGIIGAANNGVGGVGVAFGVTLTGVNIDFDNTGVYGSVNAPDINPFLSVVGQAAANFDIMSNSWGAFPEYFSGNGLLGGGFSDLTEQAYATIAANGRGGLGTIIVQAAGNDNEDANGDGLNASRFTITVAATESTGIAASYSQFGANILVAAPAAAVTTDRSDTAQALDVDAGTFSAPAFVDFDNDGDMDLVSGEEFGAIRAYTNDGTNFFT